MTRARIRLVAAGAAALTGLAGLGLTAPVAQGAQGRHGAAPPDERMAPPQGSYNVKTPTSKGYGGAVTSVDPEASRIGLEVLRRGGNAVDAAIATAAALGVTEPYSSGIGGGGYFVHYDARSGKVSTLDGRETAPRTMPHDAFVDPATGKPHPFPGAGHQRRLGRHARHARHLEARAAALGPQRPARALRPAIRLADRGFVVDQTFHDQTDDNHSAFAAFPATAELFLPGGKPPAVGSVFSNPDLAGTYRLSARRRPCALPWPAGRRDRPRGPAPAEAQDADLPIPPGYLHTRDLARYRAVHQKPTKSATAAMTSTASRRPPAAGPPSGRR